jgi:hypothetical protein
MVSQNAVENNRDFNEVEKERLRELFGKDPTKAERVRAAYCAVVKCYLDANGKPISDKAEYEKRLEWAKIGETLPEYFGNPDLLGLYFIFASSNAVYADGRDVDDPETRGKATPEHMNEFDRAMVYERTNSFIAREHLNRLIEDEKIVRFVFNDVYSTGYRPAYSPDHPYADFLSDPKNSSNLSTGTFFGTIFWDPNEGHYFGGLDGYKTLSPASALMHEVIHVGQNTGSNFEFYKLAHPDYTRLSKLREDLATLYESLINMQQNDNGAQEAVRVIYAPPGINTGCRTNGSTSTTCLSFPAYPGWQPEK